MSWRQASEPSAASAAAVTYAIATGLARNSRYLERTQCLEKPEGLLELEFRIPSLDAQEEAVSAGQRKPRHVEHRMIGHWQTIQRQHAQHGRQRGDEDGALEGDRNEHRPAVVRLAGDVERVRNACRPILKGVSADAAAESPEEHDEGQPGVRLPERLVEFLDREGRVRVH